MRKGLVALLSIVGMAGSSVPAATQVLKGSEPAAKQSTLKDKKQAQETEAGKVQAAVKMRKTTAESSAIKSDATLKARKNGPVGTESLSKKPETQLKITKSAAGATAAKTAGSQKAAKTSQEKK
jgi:hypothetical protein